MKRYLLTSLITFILLSGCSLFSNQNEFEGFHEIEEGLYVNYLPGFYQNEIALEFKVKDKNAKVYYNLNCAEVEGSNKILYTEPINLDKYLSDKKTDYPLTISVDGILANDKGGKVISNNYINNIQKKGTYNFTDHQRVVTISYVDQDGNTYSRSLSYIFSEYDIPVVSLSMPYKEWFSTTGLYNNIRIEHEKRAHFEYFDNEYDEYFYINTQVKIGGNYTIGYPQRTLNLKFNKNQFNQKQPRVNARIFKDRLTQDGSGNLDSFSRLRLHNGGNCFENYTGINDAILQTMMEGTNVSTTAYRPCILYLNGEYWGLYSLREHYKTQYFEDNYGVDKDEVAIYDYKGEFIFNDGDDSDFVSFFDELNTYLNKDFTNSKVYYDFIDKYIDVDSFIDVMIAHAFTCNRDYVGNNNNLKAWRTTLIDPYNPYADGKLRFCLHDADFAFSDAYYWNFLDPSVDNSYSYFRMFRKLLKNSEFKDAFYNRAEELIENNLSYENACDIIDEMMDEIRPYKLDSNNRWGLYYWGKDINGINEKGLAGWEYEIEYAKNFIKTRCYDKHEIGSENGNKNERNFLDAVKDALKEY